MAHALRYFCSWQSERYKHQMRLELWEKDYKGEATAMVLSGEPKLTMEEGDTICGSSLDFGLLSETNGQYLHLYTTDNHKYLIKILRDGAVMWEGYLLPEYYSEAYIAAPYTVSFTATDWLGMLKNVDFPAEDMRVPILQIIKTCLQYTELPLDFACQLDMRVEGINDTTNVLGALYLNPMTFTGYNCYEVLEKILASFNATLRQTGHRWLISSIDDELPLRLISWDSLSYTGDGQSNNGELIGTNFDGTFIDGSLVMAISPAKKSVDLSQDIFYRESWLKDYDFRSADAWAWPDNTNIVKPGLAYYIQDGVLIEQISVEYLILRTKSTHELPYLSQVINVEGAPDDSEYTLGIKFFTPNLVDGANITALWVKIINRSSTSLTQDVAYLSKDGWTNEDSYIELNGTSAEAKYISSHTYNRNGRQYLIYDKENWPTTKINFISIPYTGTLEIRIYPMYLAGFTTVINPSYYETYFGGVYLTKTNVTKNLTISSTLNPDAAETASSVNLMLCDSPEERNVELGVLNYFSLSDGALTTGKKWYYNGQEYEDFLHAIAYSYSRCYANKRQKLSGALYTDKIYNLCSFTDKWSGKRHTIKSWIYSIISERLDSMEIIETPAKEIELTLSTPEAGSSNKQNQPSGGTSGGGATSMSGSGRYVNLDTAQEVSGEKTWNDKATFKKGIVVEGDGIFGGEVVAIVGEGTPVGVTDYSALTGKPSINGKELSSGENTLAELGIQPAGDYITESLLNTKLDNYATKTFISNNYAGKSALNNHIVDSVKHITDAERNAWNNKSDLTAEDVKGIKVNNAAHADSADNATKAGSADKLTNSRKIFGLPFDGTKDVVGGITADGDSVIKGNLNVTKDGIFGGEVVCIAGDAEPAGVTNYAQLQGKPSINGKELASGENTLDALGIQPKGDYTTASQLATTLENYATKVFVSNNYAGKSAFNSHIADTNIHITSAERAAWNAKWNYNEATIKAVKVNSASSADSVAWSGISGKPTTLAGYGITDTYTATTINNKLSGYLPLTGGTITGNYGALSIKRNSPNNPSLIKFENTSGVMGYLGFGTANTPVMYKSDVSDYYALIHTGNINLQSVSFAKKSLALVNNSTEQKSIAYVDESNKAFYIGDNIYPESPIYILGKEVRLRYGAYATNGLILNSSGNVLIGTTTDNGYKLDVNGKGHYSGDLIVDGEAVAVTGEGTPAGVTDYSALTGKPAINGVTLISGNNTLASLGIQAAGDYATNSGVTTLLANYADKTFVSNNYVGKAAFNSHTADTDIHITSAERTAWNAKWNYNEATIKAVKVNSASSADSVAWSGISGKPTTFTPSAHTHTASDVSGLPTSLKNPYALSFGSKTYDGSAAATITASDLGALTSITKSMVEGVLTGDISSHTHTFASLTSKPTTIAGYGITDALTTSNYNSYAPTLTGTGASGTWGISITGNAASANGLVNEGMLDSQEKIDNFITKNRFKYALFKTADSNNVGFASNDGMILSMSWNSSSSYGAQMAFDDTFDGTVKVRCKSSSWGNWYKFLHSGNYNSYAPTLTGTGASGTWDINISGNAASATKLQTPRTIWGQSFDGTGNIQGIALFNEYDKSGNKPGAYVIINKGGDLFGIGGSNTHVSYISFGTCDAIGTWISEQMTITTTGNILIGTTTDNGYKLQVNGSERVYGDLIVDGEVSALVA